MNDINTLPETEEKNDKNGEKTPEEHVKHTKQNAKIDALMAHINKKYEDKDLSVDKEIKRLSDVTPLSDEDIISSGIYELDKALGVGGFARGRAHELRGENGTGKTTCAIHTMVEAQRKFPDLLVGYIDGEHALDTEYARALGLDLDRVLINSPIIGETGLAITQEFAESREFSLIVIDSVASLSSAKSLRNENDTEVVGAEAKMWSTNLRRIVPHIGKSNTCLLLVNQIRLKMVMNGDPRVSPGGNAIEFYPSTRIGLTRNNTQDLIDKGINNINATVFKNKLGRPGLKCSYKLVFGEGVPKYTQALSLGLDHGMIEKSGGWYKYRDQKFHGEEKILDALKNQPDLVEAIYNGEC